MFWIVLLLLVVFLFTPRVGGGSSGASDFVAIGAEANLDINGVAFDTVSGSYRDAADRVEVTGTEDTLAKRHRTGCFAFEANFEAQVDSNQTYFLGPMLLVKGNRVIVKFYPFGRVDGRAYNIPLFLITDTDGSWVVQGSRPQVLRFSGVSDGNYSIPEF